MEPPSGPTAPDPSRFSLGAWQPVLDPADDLGTGGVWRLVAEPTAVNIGLVVGRDGCLVVDTGSSPEQGAAVRAAVAGLTDRPIRAVVVTHAHHDHLFGLAGLQGPDGADPIGYGHESLATAPDDEAVRAAARGLGVDPAELVAPSRPISVAAAVDLGGIRCEAAYLGRGHTGGDLVVAVIPQVAANRAPRTAVVFAGDLVETAGPPWLGADAAALEWPATLDGLIGLLDERTVVVPGHGEPVGRDAVLAQRSELAAVAGELDNLARAGVTPDQAAERGSWPYPYEHVEAAVAPTLAELRAQGVRPDPKGLPLLNQ